MRLRLHSLAALAALAACGTPAPPPPVVRTPPAPPVEAGALIGKTSAELVQRFGTPALQITEGDGLKIQFRGACVLDAYLYRGAGGLHRTVHVDARGPDGSDRDSAACAQALAR